MKLLLSIKPQFSKKILSGEKKFEFRKQKPKKIIDQVFIYESSPSKTIVGWFSIKKIHSGSPEEIWAKCKDFGGIEKKKYFTYCNGSKEVHALEIDEVVRLSSPIDPFKIHSDFKPPQSFAYLDSLKIFRSFYNKKQLINRKEFSDPSLLDF